MNNSTISFTIHDDDPFVGLKSFTEHHFIAKRKSCLFDLSLIVCNDAKIQKNRLFNTRQTSKTLQRERAKQWENQRGKGKKSLLSHSQWTSSFHLSCASYSPDVQLHLLLFCSLTQQLTIFTLSVTLWHLEIFSFCLSFNEFCTGFFRWWRQIWEVLNLYNYDSTAALCFS